VACGLGLLTKGPVALLLVAVPLCGIVALDRRTAKPRAAGWFGYLVVSVSLALPWYAAAAACDPEFLGYFFWKHNLLRYVAPFDHAKPAWYYVPEIVVGMLPWS